MIQQILDFFQIKNITNKVDNFTNYELKFIASIDLEKIKELNKLKYDEFNLKIAKYGYDWSLEIEENNYIISQNVFNEIDFDDFDGIEEITVSFLIFKKGINVLIFDEVEFFNGIENIGLVGVLKILSNKFKSGIILVNEIDNVQFSSNYIGYNLGLKEQLDSNITLSNQCNFNNLSDFKFSPDYFNIGNNVKEDRVIELINKLYQTFIFIYIFDSSELVENRIKLKINGFKTIEYTLDFKTLEISSLSIYEKIFHWIYSEKNKVEDKIGIARNILSIYLKTENILIDENTFNSILSANNTYIKGNISKYIETRNKLNEQIEQISAKVNSSLETFYNNFQKSIFVFISFYLTIFVLKVYSKADPTSVINKEATIMALGLLFLSFLFLMFSIWILSLEKKRINEKYKSIKDRGLDLLVQDDIDKILRNDEEFKKELKFLNKRKNLYVGIWISTLIVFLTVLFTTSDYINFKYLNTNKSIGSANKKTISVLCVKKIKPNP
jgi:hypothetical protein